MTKNTSRVQPARCARCAHAPPPLHGSRRWRRCFRCSRCTSPGTKRTVQARTATTNCRSRRLAPTTRRKPTRPPAAAGHRQPAADLVKRGEYLARAGDCVACHTADKARPFAGGLPINTPFGTIYTPNITPDPDTGIGQWTDADFLRAMHEGIGKGGERLYPAFPYAEYTKVTDQRRAGHPRLSEHARADPLHAAAQRADVPVQPALADGVLEHVQFQRRAASCPIRSKAPNGIAARIWWKGWRIARNAIRRAISRKA